MADEQDHAEALDDEVVRRDDPDGERVDNLTLTDIDDKPGYHEDKDLVGTVVAEDGERLVNEEIPPAPEEDAVHVESQ